MPNSLNDPKVVRTLARLHAKAKWDWLVFARALPSVLWGWTHGRTAMDSAMPYLKDAYIPIDPDQGRALYAMARASRAKTIVEFGTSFGIGAIYLAAAARDNGGRFIGTEFEPNKAAKAREHLGEAGLSAVAEVLEGDALDTLKTVHGSIDLLLLDGWKDLCLPVLHQLESQIPPGGVILCDDISGFRRTLAPYLRYVRGTPAKYVSQLLPLGDGLEYSVFVGETA
jgi:predicted O-methyltransferase YrrM